MKKIDTKDADRVSRVCSGELIVGGGKTETRDEFAEGQQVLR